MDLPISYIVWKTHITTSLIHQVCGVPATGSVDQNSVQTIVQN